MTSTTFRSGYVAGRLFRIRGELRRGTPFALVSDRNGTSTELDVPGWSIMTWATDRAIKNIEPTRVRSSDGSLLFDLMIRSVDDRFLLLAHHAEIVESYISRARLRSLVASPVVDVSQIVGDFVSPPSDSDLRDSAYRLGSIFANVDGFGGNLKSASLYGDDLAAAGLFRSALPNLAIHRVGLKDARSGRDAVSVGIQGEVAFYYHDSASLRKSDRALAFLRRHGYIHWDDLGHKE
jgi:hypothetical protein